jgi:uroporphyrinogen-III decarboxylase
VKERIDIIVDESRIDRNEENAARLNATQRFEETDRPPVQLSTNQWFMLAGRGSCFSKYIETPKDNLREQVLNQKWRLENILDDTIIPTESMLFTPDLGCVRGVEFDIEVEFVKNEAPKSLHILSDIADIDKLAVPDPWNGFNVKKIEYYHGMCRAVEDFDVRVNGQAVELNITIGKPGGPMPDAFALGGQNIFLWMLTDPDKMHKLMDIVTESHLNCIRYFDELTGKSPNHPTGIGCDTTEMLDVSLFKEFVAPYCNRIFEAYPGPRGIHNCGQNEHLLAAYRDEMKINSHNGFGACVDPQKLADELSGRVFMQGGPCPMLVKDASPEQIELETQMYLDILAPGNGFVIGLGGGSVPGTPIEHLQTIINTVKNYRRT